MRLLLVCCFCLLGGSAAFADDTNAGSFRDKCADIGKAMVEGHKDGTYPAGFSVGYSMGYCSARIRSALALGPLLASEFKFCPPDDTPRWSV